MTADTDTVLESEAGDLRVAVTEESPTRKTLEIEIAEKRVKKAFDRAYKDLRRQANVKGFRPGKAPRSVLERLYGASIPAEIERSLIVETLQQAVELSTLQPLVEPAVESESPEAGSSFTYKARLELKPEIELPDLEGLPGKRPSADVGEDEVLTQLEELRERNAPIIEEPEGTAADEGHFVTMDYEGFVDDEPFEGGSAKGHELEIGGGRFIPGFEEQLVGARAGDDVTVEVTFPEEYGNAALSGKPAIFKVHVEALKKKTPAELDDEFAKDLGEDFETLDDLRNRIRTDLAEERAKSAETELQKSVMDSLVARTDFEVPPGIVERQLQHELQSFQQQYGRFVPEDVLQQQLGRMAEEGRPAAERRVREAFLLEAVGTAQGVEATEEEVDGRLAEMAEERGVELAQLQKMATEQGWHASIKSELVDRKALAFLTERAEIEEVQASDPA
jgi:trigger factor